MIPQPIKRAFVSTLLFSAMLMPAAAMDDTETIIVSGTEIDGLFGRNFEGPYNKVFREMSAGYDKPVNLTVFPIRRAIRLLAEKEVDCLFVISDRKEAFPDWGLNLDELILSDGLLTTAIKIYTGKGKPPVESLADIKGKIIAVDLGIGNSDGFLDMLQHDRGDVYVASTLAQGFQMLDKERIFALVAINTDVKYLVRHDASFAYYSVSDTYYVRSNKEVVACQKNEKSARFIEHVNKNIAGMKEAGKLEELFYTAKR